MRAYVIYVYSSLNTKEQEGAQLFRWIAAEAAHYHRSADSFPSHALLSVIKSAEA